MRIDDGAYLRLQATPGATSPFDRLRAGSEGANARAVRGPRAPETAPPNAERERLRGACQQFEAVFLAQLFQKMRETVPEDPLLGDSRAKDIYNGMMDWELAQQISRTQSVGLAEMLYRQLSPAAEPSAPAEGDNPRDSSKNTPG